MGSESSNFHEKMMVGGAGRSNRFQTSSPVKKKSSAAQILPHVHLSELLIKRCPTTIHRSLPISTPERLRLLRSTLPYLPLTALQESKAVLLHNPTYFSNKPHHHFKGTYFTEKNMIENYSEKMLRSDGLKGILLLT